MARESLRSQSESLFLHQMQVGRIELAGRLQSIPVQHLQEFTLQCNEALFPEFLEHPVDVHGRDPQRIGQLYLGDRQVEGMVLHQLDRSQPHQQLAQHMRHAGRRLTPPDVDHPLPEHGRIEAETLARWDRDRVFERLREQNADGPTFSFIDGPVTANKVMGVHTAWGRTLKDVFQRYQALRGRHQRYQNGWDCQGLWIEVGLRSRSA